MRSETERSIEAYLKKRVTEAGGVSFKFASPSNRGAPDRLVIYKGTAVFVEVKAPGGKLSAGQERFHRVLEANGARYGETLWTVWSKKDVDYLLASPPFAPRKRGARTAKGA
jgi:hypothetical protein